jgi:antitoxin component YwqK of YwqJK toxin-antitoxin module
MRWLLLSSLLLLTEPFQAQIIAFVQDAERVHFAEWDDSTYYLKNAPSDTSWIIYFDSTQTTIASAHYYKSKSRYDFKSWHNNGQPKKIELNNDSLPYYYKDVERWYRDGTRQSYYKTTRDSTISIYWWSNGQLSHDSRLWGGQSWNHTYGRCDFWHPSGVKYRIDFTTPDSIVSHFLFPTGKISCIQTFHSDTAAAFGFSLYYKQFFHENEKIASSPMYPHLGRQTLAYYDTSGKVVAQGEWMLDGNVGPHKTWYANGQLKSEGNYSMGLKKFPVQKVTNYYPTKTGHWIYYNEAGWKEKEEWRGIDGSVKFKEYNSKGEVIKEGETQEEIPAGTIFPKEYQH